MTHKLITVENAVDAASVLVHLVTGQADLGEDPELPTHQITNFTVSDAAMEEASHRYDELTGNETDYDLGYIAGFKDALVEARGFIEGEIVPLNDIVQTAFQSAVVTLTFPSAEAIEAAMKAAALPQKTGRGLQGGKTTKAAAQRAIVALENAAIDKANAAEASKWFEARLAEAKARARAFGAQGGLKTGKLKTGTLTTGTLTVTGLARRVAANYRRKNRKKKK